jgi:hypothetical protein
MPRIGFAQEGFMTPAELKRANLDHFKRLLDRTSDPDERRRIEALVAEERLKAEVAYPNSQSKPHC